MGAAERTQGAENGSKYGGQAGSSSRIGLVPSQPGLLHLWVPRGSISAVERWPVASRRVPRQSSLQPAYFSAELRLPGTRLASTARSPHSHEARAHGMGGVRSLSER